MIVKYYQNFIEDNCVSMDQYAQQLIDYQGLFYGITKNECARCIVAPNDPA